MSVSFGKPVMKVPLTLVPIVWSMTLVASIASAEPKGYVQAGLMVTAQPAGIANHRVSPAINGTTVGLAGGGGFYVTRTLAIEGELAWTKISTPQHFSYNWTEDYTGESRDMFLGANVRWRSARHLEFVGGGGLAFSTFAERSIVRTDFFPVARTTALPDQVMTDHQPALNGGFAVPLTVGSKIEIVPALTVRWVKRAPDGLGAYSGVGNYAYQVGGTVRFKVD